MSEDVKEVTDATFKSEVINSDLPVLVDLWAPWCGPCRMVGPVIEELASENAGRIRACKLNVDDSPETAAAYGVTSIPTILFFQNGGEVQELRKVGVQPKAVYQEAIDSLPTG